MEGLRENITKLIAVCDDATLSIACKLGSGNTYTLLDFEVYITKENFENCAEPIHFEEVVLPSDIDGAPLKRIGNNYHSVHMYNNLANDSLKIIIDKLVIPNSIDSVCLCSFSNANYIKSVVWPDSVRVIPAECFQKSSLEEIIIPNGITGISIAAFYESSLKNICLPNSFEVIGDSAFEGCQSLERITFEPATSIKRIGSDSFSNTKIKSIDLSCCIGFCNVHDSVFKHGISIIEPYYGGIFQYST